MNRDEMINELKNAGIRAVPTVCTMDMGLQYDYITPFGPGTGFGGMGTWPLYRMPLVEATLWNDIVQKVKSDTIMLEDLYGTGLDEVIGQVQTINKEINYSNLLRNIVNIEYPCTEYYCLFDAGEWYDDRLAVEFYINESEALNAFADQYCYEDNSWEDLDDQEIEDWYNRLSDDLESMSYYVFDDE